MKYLYYKLYQLFRKIKTNDTPATNAMIFLSIIHSGYVVIVQSLLNHFLNIKIKLVTKDEIILFSIVLALSIMLLNYFVLYKKRKEICEKYNKESKIQNRFGFIILILYIIGSAALVYFIGSRFPL